jgi:hypothetical protein
LYLAKDLRFDLLDLDDCKIVQNLKVHGGILECLEDIPHLLADQLFDFALASCNLLY